jgi:hypothetical protein
LGKSGADVRLCDTCFTRFAVRGLLRVSSGNVVCVDIKGWTAFDLTNFIKIPQN